MRGSSTHTSTMRFPLLVTVWAGTVLMTAAQPRCDPLTQYEADGQCCDMCGPGTSLLPQSSCRYPQCKECGENEYQDKYTKAPECQRQPYCDPNRNFEVAAHKKDTRSTCMCKLGFHCSSEDCITCVAHTVCEPGFGAEPKGSHTHDTVCKECPGGTFSNESSWDSVCKEWTACKQGYKVLRSGTALSDNTCVEETRTHTVVITVLCVVLAIGILAITLWLCRGKPGYEKLKTKVKGCFVCLGQEKTPPREIREEEEEEGVLPEENEVDPSLQEVSTDLLSENGAYVTQEIGKMETLPRQESQTQTFCSV